MGNFNSSDWFANAEIDSDDEIGDDPDPDGNLMTKGFGTGFEDSF